MADNLGNGVSRVLTPEQTQYEQVIFQWDRPPLDSEWNLVQQLEDLKLRTSVLRSMPSGWLGNGTLASEVYETSALWSNQFHLNGPSWANVNGWLVPVQGTRTGTPPGLPNNSDHHNRITLDPPPSSSGDSRIDYIFLEVWKARVPPNPANTNKPNSSAVYRYGNVEGGYDYLPDDIQDPEIGEETSQRVQIQYRIRVATGLVGLSSYPDGFDPAVVKGQGAATAPTSYTFENMANTLGDPGLWRAGDGNTNALGSVDGYVYAIPLTAVFRRNSVGWDGDPGQNLNGGVNRNPTAVDRSGAVAWTQQAALAAPMSSDPALTVLSLVTATGIPVPANPAAPLYAKIGDEVVLYSNITGTTMSITRAVLGTKAEAHPTGTEVKLLVGRPDGLFADQIAKQDLLDLRHVVSPSGFNYRSVLTGALDQLLRGSLRTEWKRSGGGPQGSTVFYQDKIGSTATMGVTKLDAPDGIREIFSDAVVIQETQVILTPSQGASTACQASWGLNKIDPIHSTRLLTGSWSPLDQITIPASSLIQGLPGADADQVQWLPDLWAVEIRIDGVASPLLAGSAFGYTATLVGQDLKITLGASFVATTLNLYCKLNYLIGPGRGLSRRPDAAHSVNLLTFDPAVLCPQYQEPSGEVPLTNSWALQWSRSRSSVWNNLLPSTAASYIDPGSKTVILTPWQLVAMPSTVKPQDGTGLNGGAGLMPGGDPLTLFSSASVANAATKNLYIQIPRHLLPTWGEVKVPILHTDRSPFYQGVNFGIFADKSGLPGNASTKNYTVRALFDTTVAYNTANSAISAGARRYTDPRGMARQGIELPPFMGLARLFGVYKQADWGVKGSAFNSDYSDNLNGATNLLKQYFDGPVFWIETDTNGDSTFIVNAECLDLSRTTLSSFSSGNYVVEASIFGFDRGAFTSTADPRILLSSSRTQATDPVTRLKNANPDVTNEDTGITSPRLVIPAPAGAAGAADTVGISYSRTPYQGDALGTQLGHTDIGYLPGSLTSGQAYHLSHTTLDQQGLTRPNQKVLEVLDSIGFATSLGTGRLSGDAIPPASNLHPVMRVGFENRTAYPPTTAGAARPALLQDGLETQDTTVALGTAFTGCTERLPLGSLWRDKDFRGAVAAQGQALCFFGQGAGIGLGGLSTPQVSSETTELQVQTADIASGAPNQVVVHVDGEQANYGLLTNYRTTRGGSAFTASGRPGGDLRSAYGASGLNTKTAAVLTGTAHLVRVAPFVAGSTTLTHGSELMLMITTTARKLDSTTAYPLETAISTAGTQEGNSAADLYRVPGRPLERDNVNFYLDPSQVELCGWTT